MKNSGCSFLREKHRILWSKIHTLYFRRLNYDYDSGVINIIVGCDRRYSIKLHTLYLLDNISSIGYIIDHSSLQMVYKVTGIETN